MLRPMTEAERLECLRRAEFNVGALDPTEVVVDLTGDALPRPLLDEADPGARREPALAALAARIYGSAHYVFAHKGRSAERMLLPAVVKPGSVVVGHPLFFSTQRAFGMCQVRPEVAELARDGSSDLELDWLARRFAASRVDFVCLEPSANAHYGWPITLENVERIGALCRDHGARLLMDATRLLANCQRLGANVFELAMRFTGACDVFWASCSKELLVASGALIGVRDEGLQHQLMDLCFEDGDQLEPRYERLHLARGIEHLLAHPELLADRARQLRALAAALRAHDLRVVEPVGGHAVYLDIDDIINRSSPPAIQSFLYQISGIRCGYQPLPTKRQVLRLTLGIGRYSDAQLEGVAPAFRALFDRTGELPVLREKRAGQSMFFGGYELGDESKQS